MIRTHPKTVAVVTGHDQPKLSKGQQTFNKLIKQIEKDVIAFEGIKKVKAWLKKVQREAAKMDDYGGCPF